MELNLGIIRESYRTFLKRGQRFLVVALLVKDPPQGVCNDGIGWHNPLAFCRDCRPYRVGPGVRSIGIEVIQRERGVGVYL